MTASGDRRGAEPRGARHRPAILDACAAPPQGFSSRWPAPAAARSPSTSCPPPRSRRARPRRRPSPPGRSSPSAGRPRASSWTRARTSRRSRSAIPTPSRSSTCAAARVLRRVALPGAPRHLAQDDGGATVLVPAETADRFLAVEVPSGRVTERAATGAYPHDLAPLAGGGVAIGDERGDALTVLRPGAPPRTRPGRGAARRRDDRRRRPSHRGRLGARARARAVRREDAAPGRARVRRGRPDARGVPGGRRLVLGARHAGRRAARVPRRRRPARAHAAAVPARRPLRDRRRPRSGCGCGSRSPAATRSSSCRRTGARTSSPGTPRSASPTPSPSTPRPARRSSPAGRTGCSSS